MFTFTEKTRKKIIHVNQHHIKANRKTQEKVPVITVKDYKTNVYGNTVVIRDGDREVAKIVYSPDKPLSCGAHVWIETNMEVEVNP